MVDAMYEAYFQRWDRIEKSFDLICRKSERYLALLMFSLFANLILAFLLASCITNCG